MREFEHKRKIKKFLFSPLVLIPMGIVLLFLVRGTWNIYEKDRDSSAELRFARDRLARIQDREAKISSAAEKLKTEAGIEGEIRDRFQMAKEGEQEIVIVDESVESKTSVAPSPSFLQKIWNFFTR